MSISTSSSSSSSSPKAPSQSNIPPRETYSLNPEMIGKYSVAKVFGHHTGQINGLDFSDCGNFCISSSNDSNLNFHRVETGDKAQTVASKKYGCTHVRFTHHPSAVLFGSLPTESNKKNHAIRYLSLHDNRFISYFFGHTEQLTSLEISPTNDYFCSSAKDNTVRLWDLRQDKECVGTIVLPLRNACIQFDPTGTIFAVATPSLHEGTIANSVRLYSQTTFQKGPFTTFYLPTPPPPNFSQTNPNQPFIATNVNFLPLITHMQFSHDCKTILISTNTNILYVIDAFNGSIQAVYNDFANIHSVPLQASFSPHSKLIFCGSSDRSIHIWDHSKRKKLGALRGHPVKHEIPQIVKWSPNSLLMASAARELYWWLPPLDVLKK